MKRILAAIVFLLCSAVVLAQVSTSRIVGTVSDKSGAVIFGASVTAQNEGTNVVLQTKTTSAGNYSFDSLQSGSYTITITMPGFRTFVSKGNVLQVGQPTTVNVTMDIGTAGEQVEVNGAAEVVQTSTSGNIGNVVDSISVNELPIVGSRGRNPLQFVLLQPGVVAGANTGGGTFVNGARDRAWNYTLDGVVINEESTPGANFTPIRTNPDMIQEFRVITGSPTAELGSTSGGQVMMVTKSGTNQFHGAFDFFYQTPSFMANDPTNKILNVKRPQWVQKIYNGSLGGPIKKNNTFFFVDIQRLTTLRTATHTSTVYTQSARNGIFRYISKNYAPGCRDASSGTNRCPHNTAAGATGSIVDLSGNVLPQYASYIGSYNIAAKDPSALGLDKTTMGIINSVPLPNNFTVGDGLNTAGYTFVAPENEKQLDVTFKIDHNFSERNSIFTRVSWGHQNTIGDLGNTGAPTYPGQYPVVNTYRTPRNVAINWRITPTNSMTNELVVGMNRFGFNFANGNPDPDKASPLILNLMTMPENNWSSNMRTLTTFQLSDNLRWIKGAHSLAFGVNARDTQHIDDRGSIGAYDARPLIYFGTSASTGNPVDSTLYGQPTDINKTYDAGNWAYAINDMLGKVGDIRQGFTSKDGKWQPGGTVYNFKSRFPSVQFYGQDSWKVKSNLTVDLGLRWELYLAPGNPQNTVLHPNQPTYIGAPPSSSLAWVPGNVFPNSLGNVGPSVGIAWDPFKDGKSSVRAAYRIAYDPINTFVLSSAIFQGLPGLTYATSQRVNARLVAGTPSINTTSFPDPIAMREPAAFSATNSISVMDPHWQPARTQMWSFSLQRALPWKMVAEVNYIGHHADHLSAANPVNQVDVLKNGFAKEFQTVAAGGESAVINQMLAGDPNLAGRTGSAYLRTQSPYSGYVSNGDVALVAASLNSRSRGGVQQIVLNGFSPYYFTPYPQFLGGMGVIDSGGWSNYEGLQMQIQRKFSNGLQFQFGYTWSKSLDTNSFDPDQTRYTTGSTQTAGNTLQNIYNRSMNYARSDFDRRHVFVGNFIVEMPFGKGKRFLHNANGLMDRLVGGWQLANVIMLEAGRPFTIYGGAYTISDQVRSWADCSGCSSGMGTPNWVGTPFAGGTEYYFTPEQKAMFSTPAPGEQGNLGRNSITMSPYKNWDASLTKTVHITEQTQLKLSWQIQNVTNSVMYTIPYSGWIGSSLFGEMNGPAGVQNYNSARRMQMSAMFSF